MKTVHLCAAAIALLAPLTLTAEPSPEPWLWPVSGQSSGEGLLYVPQQYIGDELVFNELFIGVAPGTVIVAPADGTLDAFHVGYSTTLSSSVSFREEGDTFNALLSKFRSAENLKVPPRYVTGTMGIALPDGRKIWLQGIEGDVKFKTGMKISRGDTLGVSGWAYKGIAEPHICISVSTRKGTSDDPMTPFGLETTFEAPGEFKIPETLTAEQAAEDFGILMDSYREAYPSLYDVVSREELAAFDSLKREEMKDGCTYTDFRKIVGQSAALVHDSHLAVKTPYPDTGQDFRMPNIFPGKIGDSLVVVRVVPGYEKYLRKRIVSINGVPAQERIKELENHFTGGYDADSRSYLDYFMAVAWNYYFADSPEELETLGTTHFVFSDGEELHDRPIPRRQFIRKGWTPKTTLDLDYVHREYVKYRESPYVFDILNDSTAYFGLSTFVLDDVQIEALADSVKKYSHYPYMVIDMRNNAGGNVEVIDRLLGWFLDKPSVPLDGYAKVNKTGGFECFKWSLNYSADMEIFPEFVPEEGKDGFYSRGESKVIMPDSLLNYTGKLYVLTDETSVSAATIFPATLVRNHRAVTVGRETRSGYHFMTALRFADIRLPNSGIVVRIPLVKEVFDETVTERTPAGRGLLPDYPVPLSYEEVFTAENDIVLEHALDLIAEGRYLGDNPFAEADALKAEKGGGRTLVVVIAAAAVCLAVLAAVFLRRRKNLSGTAGIMLLCLALLLPLAGCSGNKGVYTVNGNVRTLPDSTCLLLYRLTDDGYLSAVDTAYSLSGRFTLSCPLDSAAEMTLLSRDLNSMLLTLYAEPGKTASVSGSDNFLFTWNVRSNVPLQKEAERYKDNVRAEYRRLQMLDAREDSIYTELRKNPGVPFDTAAVRRQAAAIEHEADSLDFVIYDRTLDLFEKSSVSDIYFDRLSDIAMMIGYYPDKYGVLREKALDRYGRLPDGYRDCPEGKEVYQYLSVEKRVKPGDRFVDGEFADIGGGTRTISSFLGKYVLLDFWAHWCGPCLRSIPELKAIREEFGDRLDVVSLSEDPAERWKQASAEHGIVWANLNYSGNVAFKLTYGVSGIPAYFLISPDGVIVDAWSGYFDGSIREHIQKFL